MKELNLCLHCGGYRTDLAHVEAVPTPDRTETWVPIPHIELHRCIERSLGVLDMEIVNQQHGLAHGGDRWFSLYQIGNGHCNDNMTFVLGARNSHDRTFVAGLACGDGVFACDNLCFSSEIVIARKHTLNIERDLPRLCNRAVGQLAERWTNMEDRVWSYQNRMLTDPEAHDLIIRSVDAGALIAKAIPDVLRQWRTPAVEAFEVEPRNVWRLRNAFTDSFKEIGNPLTVMRRSQVLTGLLDAECGLIVKDKPTVEVDATGTN